MIHYKESVRERVICSLQRNRLESHLFMSQTLFILYSLGRISIVGFSLFVNLFERHIKWNWLESHLFTQSLSLKLFLSLLH